MWVHLNLCTFYYYPSLVTAFRKHDRPLYRTYWHELLQTRASVIRQPSSLDNKTQLPSLVPAAMLLNIEPLHRAHRRSLKARLSSTMQFSSSLFTSLFSQAHNLTLLHFPFKTFVLFFVLPFSLLTFFIHWRDLPFAYRTPHHRALPSLAPYLFM